MADHTDIVTRLRETGGLDATLHKQAADEIERLRAERDEARRSVCEMSIQLGGVYRRVGGKIVEVTTPEGCAEIMRWDCFNTPEAKVVKTLNGVIIDGGKAVPPKYEDLDNE
jgi:hypothetical protein